MKKKYSKIMHLKPKILFGLAKKYSSRKHLCIVDAGAKLPFVYFKYKQMIEILAILPVVDHRGEP